MMKENNFKEVGHNIAQIGFYLMSIDPSLFDDTQLHRNIVSLLSQMSLYLNDNLGKPLVSTIQNTTLINNETQYVSKSEAIEMYHPLITEYSLTQAIKKNEIKYIKRGVKYFFESDELKNWIDENKSTTKHEYLNKSIKFV